MGSKKSKQQAYYAYPASPQPQCHQQPQQVTHQVQLIPGTPLHQQVPPPPPQHWGLPPPQQHHIQMGMPPPPGSQFNLIQSPMPMGSPMPIGSPLPPPPIRPY